MIPVEGAEAQTGPRQDGQPAARRRRPWERGCQQPTAESGVNDYACIKFVYGFRRGSYPQIR